MRGEAVQAVFPALFLYLRYMKVIVLNPQQVPDTAAGTHLGLSVFKPDFTDMLAAAFDFDTYIGVFPGVYPVIGLGVIPVQRASPPFPGLIFIYFII
jgi:hypothetical protein